MKAQDVTATLDLALAASGLDQMTVVHRPRLLSDNGSSYVATDLAEWLDHQKMEHVRSAPYHPQTQGKIERWHQTLKKRILLEHYYLPGDLERQVACPSSDDLRQFGCFRKGGSGSSVIEIMRHAVDAANDDWRWSGV